MKLCSYVVRYDHGFAPNPYWGYCTMACCKASLRKSLAKNDWIVGTSSKTRHGTSTRLVYAMKVTGVLSFDDYSKDPRFQNKIPRYGLIEQRGDNIYHRDEEGVFHQSVPSYHSRGLRLTTRGMYGEWIIAEPWVEHEGRKKKDLKGEFVPISSEGNFWYFGRGKELPPDLHWVIKGGQGYKCNHPISQIELFENWITQLKPGIHGEPFDLEKTPLLPAELWKTESKRDPHQNA